VKALTLWIFESPKDLDEVSKRFSINNKKVRFARLKVVEEKKEEGGKSGKEDVENFKNGDMEDSLNVIWKHLELEKSARDRSLLLYKYGNSVTVEAMEKWLKERKLTARVVPLAMWIFKSPEDLDKLELKRVKINKQKVRVARLDGSQGPEL